MTFLIQIFRMTFGIQTTGVIWNSMFEMMTLAIQTFGVITFRTQMFGRMTFGI